MIVERVHAEASARFQELAMHYEESKKLAVAEAQAVWLKERDELHDANRMLCDQIKSLQESTAAAQRDALASRAALHNAAPRTPVRESTNEGRVSPGPQEFRIGSTESINYHTPVNSGSTPTVPENVNPGIGGQRESQCFEPAANTGRDLARSFLEENRVSAPAPQPAQTPAAGEVAQPGPQPQGPFLGQSDGGNHTITHGRVTRNSNTNFMNEDLGFIRGGREAQNQGGTPGQDPPPGGTGGESGAQGVPNSGEQYSRGNAQGGAPGGGEPPAGGTVNIAHEANRSDPGGGNNKRA